MSTLIERLIIGAKLLRRSSQGMVGDDRHWMKDCANDCEQAAQELARLQRALDEKSPPRPKDSDIPPGPYPGNQW